MNFALDGRPWPPSVSSLVTVRLLLYWEQRLDHNQAPPITGLGTAKDGSTPCGGAAKERNVLTEMADRVHGNSEW